MNDRPVTPEMLAWTLALAMLCLALWLAFIEHQQANDGFTETPEGQPAVAEHVVIWEPAERPTQSCKWLLDDWQCTEVGR